MIALVGRFKISFPLVIDEVDVSFSKRKSKSYSFLEDFVSRLFLIKIKHKNVFKEVLA